MIVCGIGILCVGVGVVRYWTEDIMYQAVRRESWGDPDSFFALRLGVLLVLGGVAFAVRHGWLLYQCMV